MKKLRNTPAGSLGRAGGAGRGAKKKGLGGKLLLAFITLCNLALSLALALQRRRQVLLAVKDKSGEGTQVLLSAQKETKTLEEREISP